MLPSTGYFKGINCPFYDSGLCERPYCHFRHVKKESQNICSEGIESGEILQKLVSAAVQKVLQQTDTGATSLTQGSISEKDSLLPGVSKVTYNPTPISELNKINNIDFENIDDINEQKRRHIPVPYTPRKPTSLPIKRPVDTNGSKLFTYTPPVKYTPGSEVAQIDPYLPKGTVESTEKYLPGTETSIPEYTPDETQNSTKVNYIPTDKNVHKKKVLEYKPVKLKPQLPSLKYQPTPKSLVPCFSSDEDDEPENKKRKLSNDLNGLDDLGPEFDILGQILDEEKTEKDINNVVGTISSKEGNDSATEKNKEKSITPKESTKEGKTKSSSKLDKNRSEKKAENKAKEKSKEKLDDKGRKEKHTNSDKKSSHKSSSKDRSKTDRKSKTEKSSHTKDKSSDKSSRHSSTSSRHSKHDKKDKYEAKHNDNSHHKSSYSHSKDKDKKGSHKKRSEKEKTKSALDLDDNHCYEEELNDISESDEETIAEECKRIFEEYVPEEKLQPKNEIDKSENELDNEEFIVTSKKRVSRTIDKNIKIIPKAPIKPDFKVNAAQAMAERLAKVREFHASKNSDSSVSTDLKPENNKMVFSTPPSNVTSKIRIAHVPYASTLLSAKKTITPKNVASEPDPSTSSTIIQTVKKGVQRVAHIPNEKFIDRPGVLEPLGSKIPANIRSTYLNMMIDHCLNIYLSPTDAYARAQHEELTTSKKCSTVQIYKNSAVLTISRLKKELRECNGIKKSGNECMSLQKNPHSTVNKSGSAGSWSIENKHKRNFEDVNQFTGSKLYNNIKKWILTEEQLKANGFPMSHSSGEKGRAIIYGQNKKNPPKGFIRNCCRCKKDYTVDKKGFAAIKEECIYHPNNKYRVRGEVRYQCCSQDGTSDGCCVASSHVYEYVDFENLKGYVKTLPPESVMEDYGVYSLDCEMCYTTHGLDLTRVTVINASCKVVYETLIKPLHPIIDYNTRYSGITEEQMSQVKTTLLEVQATLLAMFNSKTILIGHSLESDFKALKLIHDTVVDTSVLFPHKMGPPYKRALRNLSSEYLKKIIQNSVDGHDSAEDATVCMELILFKVREDLKMR